MLENANLRCYADLLMKEEYDNFLSLAERNFQIKTDVTITIGSSAIEFKLGSEGAVELEKLINGFLEKKHQEGLIKKSAHVSIANSYKNRSKENIESLLLKYHKSDDYVNSNEVKPYKEISEKERKKVTNLIKENSEIKKDNYKVMFESLFIVINELLYQKKKQRQSAIMSPKRSVLLTTPNSPRFVSRMMSKTSTIKKTKQLIKLIRINRLLI